MPLRPQMPSTASNAPACLAHSLPQTTLSETAIATGMRLREACAPYSFPMLHGRGLLHAARGGVTVSSLSFDKHRPELHHSARSDTHSCVSRCCGPAAATCTQPNPILAKGREATRLRRWCDTN